ncbi:glycerol-3-phosphate 1-O-acyltransferase PlsB [Kushneria aurantia]|uniref:Glycerol-3-phosphate acyltransferase n=1 Tax=Kushneria aurantia TaxID=504092 RepID=A0ABV6G2L7_9GAMM|nr:glycerol-3-phosphate 1-O-acyltransferase PlsB [Kushneria aurantia]
MSPSRSSRARLVRLFNRLAGRWLHFRATTPQSPDTLVENSDRPLVYVLPVCDFADRVALTRFCAIHRLPSPTGETTLADGTRLSSTTALFDGARYRRHHGHVDYSAALDTMIAAQQRSGEDVMLMPVTLFWGRAPQRDRGHPRYPLLHRLAAGVRRLSAVVMRARALEVRFGEPLSLAALVERGDAEAGFARVRATRFLRRYFQRVRLQAIGPDLSPRRVLVQRVLRQRAVSEAISADAEERGHSREQSHHRAERYAEEIAAAMSAPVMRLLYRLLGQLWNRLYDGVEVHDSDAIEELAGTHELVYVPCHRSHIDYLLLSWVLYRQGLMPPHIAAGRNLDMPLIGRLLRGAGAFFMRRSFRDNRLYATVFNEYLHQLLSRGHPVEYFIEGGRSRTGRMLAPRPGMLSMTLRSHARAPTQPMAFVPVYIGYEKVLESRAYIRELRTGHKRRESPLGLLRALRHLRQPFGRVQVSFGEPLEVGAWLDREVSGWRDAPNDSNADWLRRAVPGLGFELAARINQAAALTPVSMVALVLLATSHRTIEVELLAHQLESLDALQRHYPGAQRLRLPQGDAAQWIERSLTLGLVSRVEHPLGDLITVDSEHAALLTWYRNNALHLFALHALVAFAFRNNRRLDFATLEALLSPLWPALREELYIDDGGTPFERQLHGVLNALQAAGLLIEHQHQWQRPADELEARERLYLLGRIIQPTLERGFILLSTLLRYADGGISRASLVEQSGLLAERLTRLQGLNAPEFFDRRLFTGLLDTLARDGWLEERDGGLHVDPHLPETLGTTRRLFDPALRHRLSELTARLPRREPNRPL